MSLSQLSKKINDVAIEAVLDAKQGLHSLQSQPQPREWFKLAEHVNDCRRSKIISMARSANLQLGNRMRNKYGNQWKTCPICSTNGRYVKLNEPYILLECPVTKWPPSTSLDHYLGQDGCNRMELLKRARSIHLLAEKWMDQTKHM